MTKIIMHVTLVFHIKLQPMYVSCIFCVHHKYTKMYLSYIKLSLFLCLILVCSMK